MTEPRPRDPPASLADVLVTDELARRPSRAPDFEAESRALRALAEAMAADAGGFLPTLTATVLDLCRADSAGVRVLVPGEGTGVFRWKAVAGRFAPEPGGDLPHDRSPCGAAVERDTVLLLDRPHRHFPALAGVEPPIAEALVAPFRVGGEPAGTLWAVAHAPGRRFDAEDARLLAGLARFAAACRLLAGREEAMDALRESEEKHRLIVEGARDYAILTTDSGGRIESWSPGAEAVLGWSAAEAVGLPVDATFTPEDRAAGEPEKELAEARATGSAPDVRWHLRRDGSRVFIEGVTRALRGPGGELRGFLKVGQDVTLRRRTEAALRKLNESLERRVGKRTEALDREARGRMRAETARTEALRQLVDAEEQERLRLSRELHDQMGQLVTALTLGLRALRTGPADEAALRDLEGLTEQIAREVHEVASALRPPALDRLGLRRALEAHLEEWSARYGVACDFHAVRVDVDRFPPAIEAALFRAVQEGLTNVARHAGAGRVSLVLERRRGTVGVVLEDDGRGFDVNAALDAAASAGRVGLRGMRERVELLGGTLEVESAPGSGTTLFVRLPARPGAAG